MVPVTAGSATGTGSSAFVGFVLAFDGSGFYPFRKHDDRRG